MSDAIKFLDLDGDCYNPNHIAAIVLCAASNVIEVYLSGSDEPIEYSEDDASATRRLHDRFVSDWKACF